MRNRQINAFLLALVLIPFSSLGEVLGEVKDEFHHPAYQGRTIAIGGALAFDPQAFALGIVYSEPISNRIRGSISFSGLFEYQNDYTFSTEGSDVSVTLHTKEKGYSTGINVEFAIPTSETLTILLGMGVDRYSKTVTIRERTVTAVGWGLDFSGEVSIATSETFFVTAGISFSMPLSSKLDGKKQETGDGTFSFTVGGEWYNESLIIGLGIGMAKSKRGQEIAQTVQGESIELQSKWRYTMAFGIGKRF